MDEIRKAEKKHTARVVSAPHQWFLCNSVKELVLQKFQCQESESSVTGGKLQKMQIKIMAPSWNRNQAFCMARCPTTERGQSLKQFQKKKNPMPMSCRVRSHVNTCSIACQKRNIASGVAPFELHIEWVVDRPIHHEALMHN